ncbi:hypothetical protein Tco_0529292 [Tanacetum coccineum]
MGLPRCMKSHVGCGVIDGEGFGCMLGVNQGGKRQGWGMVGFGGNAKKIYSNFEVGGEGPEASGALSKKRKKPKSKRPPTKTKESPPKPTEGSEQSHLVSSGTVPDPQDLERDIQLASTGLPSILDEGTRPSKPLPKGTVTHPKDLGGNKQPLDRDITSMTFNEGTAKTTPRLERSLGDKDSGGNIPPANIWNQYTLLLLILQGLTSSEVEPDTEPLKLQTYANIQPFLLSDDELDKDSDEEEVLVVGDDMDEDPQDDKEVRTPSPKQDQPELSYVQESASDSSSPDLEKFNNILPLTEWQLNKYLRKMSRASVDQYYDKNIAHRDQTDKLVEAFMSSLDRNVSNAIKDDPATNQKLNEATETLVRISLHITEALSLVKGFDFSALISAVKSLQDHAVKQEEASTAWMKSSTNMAWNLGSRMSGVELSQTALKREISSLKKDTSEIKSMMTKMYAAFQGHLSSALSSSVTPILALTDIQANVEGENVHTTATEEPPSHTEGETEEPRLAILISSIPSTVILPTQAQPITSIIIHPESSQATPKIDKGKGIVTDSNDDPSKKLVKTLSIVRPDPDEPVRVEFMINGKVEEAENIGLDPKAIKGAKADEMFKKAQDAEHAVLKRQYTKKVRKSLELRKHKYDSYMWIVSSRLKSEPIADIKIHLKTKLVVIRVYKGTNGRNFEVHKPFLFGAFGIFELDELREIIPKKKNAVVKDLMNSLSRRYERLKKIPKEIGIHFALPALAPEQALF